MPIGECLSTLPNGSLQQAEERKGNQRGSTRVRNLHSPMHIGGLVAASKPAQDAARLDAAWDQDFVVRNPTIMVPRLLVAPIDFA